jgi:hypothetical protein
MACDAGLFCCADAPIVVPSATAQTVNTLTNLGSIFPSGQTNAEEMNFPVLEH